MPRLSCRAALIAGIMLMVHAAHADDCTALAPAGQLPAIVVPALTQRTTLLCNQGYASLNSGIAHEPLWSAEHLTEEDLEQDAHLGRVTKVFHADLRIPEGDRAELSDYRDSGYDRGHLSPSGESLDAVAQAQTFSLGNVVPQTAALNEGVWAGVEMAVRDLARQDGEIYVVTGPVFSGSPRRIGADAVWVPVATFKAVYDPADRAAGVYVCDNTDAPRCQVSSIDEITSLTGVDPFPGLPREIRSTMLSLPPPRVSPYYPRSKVLSGWDNQIAAHELMNRVTRGVLKLLYAVLNHPARTE